MVKVLIVEDQTEKQGDIYNLLIHTLGREHVEVKFASYAHDAKYHLRSQNVDIMILDICIPLLPGQLPSRDGGIRLLQEIKGTERIYTYPKYVIALSEYEDLIRKFNLQDGIIHTAIHYDVNSNEWNIRLSECVKTVATITANNVQRRTYMFDIAVICALKEELDYVKEAMQDLEECCIQDEELVFYKGWFHRDNKKISVVAASFGQKGMAAAATLTTKLIHNFIPKYVVMTGIAAGIQDKVNMGDIVVAKYAWDYGAGKEVVEEDRPTHKNTIEQISIDTKMETWVSKLADDPSRLAQIQNSFKNKMPNSLLRLHCGPVATGAAVIADIDKVKEIQNQIRDVIAIEMEIYGVYHAAKWAIDPKPHFVAIKSVCDFADVKKSNDYHNYAAFTSAKVFQCLAEEYFEY